MGCGQVDLLLAGVVALFPLGLILAAVSDLLTMTIPNRLVLGLGAVFLVAALLIGLPLTGWGWHAMAGTTLLVVCFTLFALGWMGGGDAKLAAVIGLWLGWGDPLLQFGFLVAIYGGLLTLVILIGRKAFPVLPRALHGQSWLLKLHDTSTGIPYGIALAAAGLQAFSRSVWFPALGVL